MRLVKIQAYDGTMADVEISAPRKVSAPSQNLSGKVWRPLTIWARQNLPLPTSSWSGWRALVQILVDVLILRHVDLKWSEGSGRSAFMGGVSPLLYWLVVPARLVKISADAQNSCGCANFHHFLWKIKNSISAPKCPITAPKIRTWSLLLSKFSHHIHRLLNGGHPRLWGRLPRSVHNPLGGGVWGGVALISAPLLAQAMRDQVAPGCTAVNLVLFINPVSLSFSSTFLCIAAAGQ